MNTLLSDQTARYLFYFLLLAVSIFLLDLMQPILAPFVIAALFAYLGDPVVDRLEAKGFNRTGAVMTVFSLMTILVVVVIFLLIPVIANQFDALRKLISYWLEWMQHEMLPWLQASIGVSENSELVEKFKESIQKNWQQTGDLLNIFLSRITKSSLMIVAFIGNLVLIPVVTFYLLRDWDKLIAAIHQMLPQSKKVLVSRLASECDSVLGAFLRGQLMIMTILGILYAVGLSLMGLDLAVILGVLAGAASVVPYLGPIVGIVVAGAATIFQFQDPIYLLPMFLVFGLGQLVESFYLTPVLVGDKIGLHPVAVIFAVMAGGQLYGFVGVLLALPVAAVLVILLRHLHHGYKESIFYQDEEESVIDQQNQDT